MRLTVLLPLLLACAPKAAPSPQIVVLPSAPGGEPAAALSAVLAGATWIALSPVELQRAELAAAESAFQRTRLPSERIRLALSLTLCDVTLRDPTRARALLTEAPFSPDHGAWEAVARLVMALLDERAEHAADLDEAADRIAAEVARRRELEARLEGMAELERRLEALKALETEGVGP